MAVVRNEFVQGLEAFLGALFLDETDCYVVEDILVPEG